MNYLPPECQRHWGRCSCRIQARHLTKGVEFRQKIPRIETCKLLKLAMRKAYPGASVSAGAVRPSRSSPLTRALLGCRHCTHCLHPVRATLPWLHSEHIWLALQERAQVPQLLLVFLVPLVDPHEALATGLGQLFPHQLDDLLFQLRVPGSHLILCGGSAFGPPHQLRILRLLRSVLPRGVRAGALRLRGRGALRGRRLRLPCRCTPRAQGRGEHRHQARSLVLEHGFKGRRGHVAQLRYSWLRAVCPHRLQRSRDGHGFCLPLRDCDPPIPSADCCHLNGGRDGHRPALCAGVILLPDPARIRIEDVHKGTHTLRPVLCGHALEAVEASIIQREPLSLLAVIGV
mmetsp:Transcript_11667/g.27529  ORF Transcript_11667/g.27529 Transcript_11667/m.27529 type:complete len:345 (-) Transcript_11667:325-1359(-)